ncbi:MAG: family 1 glycosylhydrolase, partial [Actinomycetota bacterium]
MSEGRPFPDFAWAIGEEGSDPIVMRRGERFRQDQFAASGHDTAMEQDLAAIAELGANVVRYGTPWRLAEPEPGVYDWSRWDRALAACAAVGLEPVIEFLHFGLPDHLPGFVGREWIGPFVRYVEAFLARYPEPCWFTPINEPGITARFSARFGLWNDMLTTEAAHARALANVVEANLEALARIRADRDGWWIGSEGFDVPVAVDDSPTSYATVEHQRALGWLVWDLHFGRDPGRPEYLDGVAPTQLDRIRELAVRDQLVAGLDIYPVSVSPVGGSRPDWTPGDLVGLAVAEIERWHDRYDLPFWIAETSNLTLPVEQQVPWLDHFAAGLADLRAGGR